MELINSAIGILTNALIILIILSSFRKNGDDQFAVVFFCAMCTCMLYAAKLWPDEIIYRHHLICATLNYIMVVQFNLFKKSSLIISLKNIVLAFMYINVVGLVLSIMYIDPAYYNFGCVVLYSLVFAVILNKRCCDELGNIRIRWFDNLIDRVYCRRPFQLQVFTEKAKT